MLKQDAHSQNIYPYLVMIHLFEYLIKNYKRIILRICVRFAFSAYRNICQTEGSHFADSIASYTFKISSKANQIFSASSIQKIHVV